jgi:hypothetical protein
MVRIAGIDPGKQKSSFAFVGIKVEDDTVFIEGARAWQGKAYLAIEQELVQIHQRFRFDFYVVEQNNTGVHVIEVLRSKNLPVISVFTSKDIKNPRFGSNVMDKNDMVKWMLIKIKEKKIVFPQFDDKYTKELKRQLSIFEEKKTEAGTLSYSAPSSEQDDYVMALMLACFYARERYLGVNSGPPVVAGGRYSDYYDTNDPVDYLRDMMLQRVSSFTVTDISIEFPQ